MFTRMPGKRKTTVLKGNSSIGWLAACFLLVWTGGASTAPTGSNQSSDGFFSKAAVASENPLCSAIGADILKAGGNAVDSAISTLICIGVTNNQSSGIGGGGFMLIRMPGGEGRVIDFREEAPASAREDMFVGRPQDARYGGKSVAIPGEIAGMALAHRRYGRLPWAQLFSPNIDLARKGFQLNWKSAEMIAKNAKDLKASAPMRETYFNAQGKPKKEGDMVWRPNLAKTLQEIADNGADAFYKGRIADALIEEINRTGGNITKADFEGYRAKELDALTSTYRGYRLFTAGPPAAGSALIQALNILENFSLSRPHDITETHQVIEALKFAYAGRMKLADPDFVPMTEIVNRMMDKGKALKLKELINDGRTFDPDYYLNNDKSGVNQIRDHGTTHVNVLDENGMAVSTTSTVNLEFGSKIMNAETGIILNNEMDDFSIPGTPNEFALPPSPSNYVRPGKRPVSSSAPVILERNGKIALVIGGTGGSRILSSVLITLVSLIDHAMTPMGAVNLPRLHHQLIPNKIIAEFNVNQELLNGLRTRGHEIDRLPGKAMHFSSVHVIKVDTMTGEIVAAADARKGGQVDGY